MGFYVRLITPVSFCRASGIALELNEGFAQYDYKAKQDMADFLPWCDYYSIVADLQVTDVIIWRAVVNMMT